MNTKGTPSFSTIAIWVIQAMWSIVLVCAGFIMSLAFDHIEHVQEAVEDMPKEYVLKDDYRSDQQEIMDALNDIRTDIKTMLSEDASR